jgi:hypothetical protein
MAEHSAEILNAICEIRELVRLLAEPAIAERDRKLRDDLRRIVGSSTQKSKSTLLMNGLRTQKDIRAVTGITSGNLSTFVKQLKDAGLVLGDGKQPTLTISIPGNFFEAEAVIDRR